MKCLQCGGDMTVSRGTYKGKTIGLPNITLAGVEIRRCAACSEEEVAIPKMEDLLRVLSSELVKKPGRLTGAEVRFLRKYLGWSGEDFARHMGVARETVSRWENEHENMGPVAERLLRAFVLLEKPIDAYRLADIEAADAGKNAPLRAKASIERHKWELVEA